MIDFSKIHSFNHGQRHSFEELVCQLGRREHFPEHSVFKRVEGAGGDGGVEAYWTKPDGKKTGYQAKYFLRCGDIDWDQIEESVTQALTTHPKLERYVVAIPCDLTDRSGKKGRGQTGWEHWDARVQKWKAEAITIGITDIEFKPWTKSELTALLMSNTEGLKEYFFGDVQLSSQWFNNKIQEAILALDERFHPEDHVDVRIERLFSVISRTPAYREELLKALGAIRKWVFPDKLLSGLKQPPEQQVIDELQQAIAMLFPIENQINFDPQHEWDAGSWCNLAEKLLVTNSKLQQWFWQYEAVLNEEDRERYELRKLIQKSRELDEAVELLTNLLRSHYMDAEKKGIAFICGNAGSGKSHLLAKCADNAIQHEHPAILLLGQRLNNSDIWIQISQMLDLTGRSAEQILGALDAAGKSAGVRTLLLIDAINEGAGSKYWRSQIASLIHKLKGFSHICCVISCRSEYFELAVPDAIAKQYPVFDIRGFETPEEQLNAARVYLDRRGIARPSTPWLSPEFVNPLFLRSVCLSLERDKKSEFPSGLTGTRKILKYYLDSIGRNITEKEGSTVSLVPKLWKAVLDIAGKMLEIKQDFLEFDTCRDTITAHFIHIHPQTEPDWLSVFLNNGLLRKDPNPSVVEDFIDEDVVRFSFQRFQDFLMAERALQNVERVDGLFDDKGPLVFCIEGKQFAWEWRGLMDALAVALPEKFQIELVDALPGGTAKWWGDWSIHEAFAESVKWRARSAFTERTLELLNDFRYRNPDPLELLLQIAVSSGHPWNAEFLHRNLARRKLPDRDAFWTKWINTQTDDADSSVGILIEWCRVGQVPHTNSENQFLAGSVLCWFFTSSNRAIRDKSTKALVNILLANEEIFPNLLNRFINVDDLYILERLLAAAYASCCLRPEPERLSQYSETIFEHIFKAGCPPFGILLRDYALGIVELASYRSVLPSTVNLEVCRPPYISPKLRLNVSKEQLNDIAKKAGDEEIVRSAGESMGDFSNYEIRPRVGHFLRVPLNKEIPLSGEQKARVFETEVIGYNRQRMQAFERLKDTANPYSYGLLSPTLELTTKKPTQKQIDKLQKDIARAEQTLLGLLSDDEVKRFCSEAAPYLYERKHDNREEKIFDLNAIMRWVAKRAYDYGWTQQRFAHDYARAGRYSRDRSSVERIGKKYQWLALDELLCKLADNYWMDGEYGHPPKPYGSPLDIGFERDIDPTIIEEKENHVPVSKTLNNWAFEPWINLDPVEEDQLVEK
jgi:hypothetical protein